MKLTREHLDAAARQAIISTEQADALWSFLRNQPHAGARFDFTHVLYYLGGLIAIGAMSLFMTLGWETFGGWGIFFIALAYLGVGLKLALRFEDKGYPVPTGICAAFAVAMVPLAIYGLQVAMGWWPDDTAYRDYHRYIKWHWIFLELGTLAAAAVIAWRFRHPFLLMPVAVTLWYMSMDVAAMLVVEAGYDWQFRAFVSLWFGLAMTLFAFWIDLRSRHATRGDYAFWLYLFGVLTFWGGLSAQHSDSELNKFLYFCINLALIGIGAVLIRRVFVVFGALGCAAYLGHLANRVFADSWLFPIVLSAIGLGIIYLGILWQRNEKRLSGRLRGHLPQPLQELLASRME